MVRALSQIEQQDFRVFRTFDGQLLLVANRSSVSLIEFLAIQFDCSARDLQPTVTSSGELVSDFFSGLQKRDVSFASWLIFTDPSLALRDAIRRSLPRFSPSGKLFCS